MTNKNEIRILTSEKRIVLISEREETEIIELVLIAKAQDKDIRKEYKLIKGKKGSLIIN